MSVTDIRTRLVIQASDEDLAGVIAAALGGELVICGDGSYLMAPHQGKSLGVMGHIFNSLFANRRFSDLRSLACTVIDLQIEQLMIAGDELRELRCKAMKGS